MACGRLREGSPSNHFEHCLGIAASVNLFCTMLCFCIQLQAVFGSKDNRTWKLLHYINFISNHVALELDLCLLHINVSQSIAEAKATLQSRVKCACECIKMYVLCLFSPTFSANCDDDSSTPVAAQYAATLWFRADLLTRWGSGAVPSSYNTCSKFSSHSEQGVTSSYSPFSLRLRPLACLVIFFHLFSSLLLVKIGKF